MFVGEGGGGVGVEVEGVAALGDAEGAGVSAAGPDERVVLAIAVC